MNVFRWNSKAFFGSPVFRWDARNKDCPVWGQAFSPDNGKTGGMEFL